MWRDRLGAVDQHAGPVALGHLRHLRHGQNRAQRVRGMGQGNELRSRAQQGLVLLHHDLAPVGHGYDPQDGPFFFGDHLPGNDVGVMLERRENDFIAGLKELAAVGLRDEVDSLSRPPHEDDLFCGTGPKECLDLLAGLLVGVGCTGGQGVGAAVNVGIVVRIEIRDGVDHALRLLRRRGIVEPHERLAVDLLIQDRKILADGRHVEGGGRAFR